jgi:hypothetical protein
LCALEAECALEADGYAARWRSLPLSAKSHEAKWLHSAGPINHFIPGLTVAKMPYPLGMVGLVRRGDNLFGIQTDDCGKRGGWPGDLSWRHTSVARPPVTTIKPLVGKRCVGKRSRGRRITPAPASWRAVARPPLGWPSACSGAIAIRLSSGRLLLVTDRVTGRR